MALLSSSDYKTKYGSTYTELRFNYKPALLYNVIYMFRRLVFAATAVFLQDYPAV